MAESSTCNICGGDGYLEDRICQACYGTGSLPPLGILAYVAKEIFRLLDAANDASDKLDDILDKLADIQEKLNE